MDESPSTIVWDVPIRLFHWLLAGLITFSWWSAEYDHLDWHIASGLSILFLILFRLMWGFIGSSTARFGHFVKGPRAVLGYLKGTAPAQAGHNPLGALSVLALLLIVALQVATGLLSTDTDSVQSGPLSHWVDYDTSRSAADIHELGFYVLLALIIIHVLAIALYFIVKKRNLVRAMITGRDAAHAAGTGFRSAGVVRLVVAGVIAGALTSWVARGAPL